MKTRLLEIARTLDGLAEEYRPPLEVLGEGVNCIQLSANFNLREFICTHCGVAKVDPELIRRLQIARDRIGRPIVVTSGYRCPTHNRAVGGAANSQHLYGTAADVMATRITIQELYDVLESLFPDGGVGIYQGHVHVDVRGIKARWTG